MIKDENFKKELNEFLGRASLSTYAGSGAETDSGIGFHELEFREGDWHYRDSYTGFFQSWGREVVWYKEKIVWNSLYGGGMVSEYHGNRQFAHDTFSFLKKVLSAGEKVETFQPRGPNHFKEGDWEYNCDWKGDIESFNGDEKISYQGKVVFTHHFFGGFVVEGNP